MKKIFILLLFTISIISRAQKVEIVLPTESGFGIRTEFDPNGKFLYAFNPKGIVTRDIVTGKQLATVPLNINGEIYSTTIDPSGTKIAVTVFQAVKVFSLKTKKLLYDISVKDYQPVAVFSQDGQAIYVAGENGIAMYETSTGSFKKQVIKSSLKVDQINKIKFFDNGSKMLLPEIGGWSIVDLTVDKIIFRGKTPMEIDIKATSVLSGMVFSASNYIPNKGGPGKAYAQDMMTGEIMHTFNEDSYNIQFIPSCDDDQLLVNVFNNTVTNLKLYDGKSFIKKDKVGEDFKFGDNARFIGSTGEFFANSSRYSLPENKILTKYNSSIGGVDRFLSYNATNNILVYDVANVELRAIDLLRMVPGPRKNYTNGHSVNLPVATNGLDTIVLFPQIGPAELQDPTQGKVLTKFPLTMPHLTESPLFLYQENLNNVVFAERITRESKTFIKNYDFKTKAITTIFTANNLKLSTISYNKKYIAAFEWKHNTVPTFGVWELSSGKRLFTAPAINGDQDFSEASSISISDDCKSLLIAKGSFLYTYDISSGRLLTKSRELKRFYNGSDFEITATIYGVSRDLQLYAMSNKELLHNERSIFVFNQKGERLFTFDDSVSTPKKILFSNDNRLLYSIAFDGRIVIYDLKEGKLLGTLYLFSNTQDYVFMTPDGRFDGTPDGIKQIYFLRGQETVSADKYFEKYYTPSLYQRLLAGETFPPVSDDTKPMPEVDRKSVV